jgi:dTDP-glucose pyrophosphorylase
MIEGGADKLCFVIGPGKSDILEYYAGGYGTVPTVFAVQPRPAGLCDAIFHAVALVRPDEPVLIGLPDTIWYPPDGFVALPDDRLAFLLFPVDRPEFFDAVVLDEGGHVREIQVKQENPASHWIWGAFKMPGRVLHELHALWRARDGRDEYFGTLVNAFLAAGGEAIGIKAGTAYVDVGTFNGYRTAINLLEEMAAKENAPGVSGPTGSQATPPLVREFQ